MITASEQLIALIISELRGQAYSPPRTPVSAMNTSPA
jgi:hypothetical protein